MIKVYKTNKFHVNYPIWMNNRVKVSTILMNRKGLGIKKALPGW